MAGRGDFQPYTPRWGSRATSASELLFWGVKVKVELFSTKLRAQKAAPAALGVRVKVAIKGLLTDLNLFDLPTNAGPLSG